MSGDELERQLQEALARLTTEQRALLERALRERAAWLEARDLIVRIRQGCQTCRS